MPEYATSEYLTGESSQAAAGETPQVEEPSQPETIKDQATKGIDQEQIAPTGGEQGQTSQRAKPYPYRGMTTKKKEASSDVASLFKELDVKIPLLQALKIPPISKFIKDYLAGRITEDGKVIADENVSSLVQRDVLPSKHTDPGVYTLPIVIGDVKIDNAMCDLGASINVLPYSIYQKLGGAPLAETDIVIQLADRSCIHPEGILEDVIVKLNSFSYPADFYVIKMREPTSSESSGVLLGRPFLKTAQMIIDCGNGTICVDFFGEKFTFNIDEMVKRPSDHENVYFIDRIDPMVQEYLEEEYMQKYDESSNDDEKLNQEVTNWCDTLLNQELSDEDISKAIMDFCGAPKSTESSKPAQVTSIRDQTEQGNTLDQATTTLDHGLDQPLLRNQKSTVQFSRSLTDDVKRSSLFQKRAGKRRVALTPISASKKICSYLLPTKNQRQPLENCRDTDTHKKNMKKEQRSTTLPKKKKNSGESSRRNQTGEAANTPDPVTTETIQATEVPEARAARAPTASPATTSIASKNPSNSPIPDQIPTDVLLEGMRVMKPGEDLIEKIAEIMARRAEKQSETPKTNPIPQTVQEPSPVKDGRAASPPIDPHTGLPAPEPINFYIPPPINHDGAGEEGEELGSAGRDTLEEPELGTEELAGRIDPSKGSGDLEAETKDEAEFEAERGTPERKPSVTKEQGTEATKAEAGRASKEELETPARAAEHEVVEVDDSGSPEATPQMTRRRRVSGRLREIEQAKKEQTQERKRKGKQVVEPPSKRTRSVRQSDDEPTTEEISASDEESMEAEMDKESGEESEDEDFFLALELKVDVDTIKKMKQFPTKKLQETYKGRKNESSSMKSGRKYHRESLRRVGLLDQFHEHLGAIGFESLLNLAEAEIPLTLALEFFTTFKFSVTSDLKKKSISFRTYNEEWNMNLQEWTYRMGLVSAEPEKVAGKDKHAGLPGTNKDFNSQEAWEELTEGESGEFKASQSKGIYIADPALRFTQVYLGYNLLGAASPASTISHTELYLMWCMKRKIKVHLGFWMAYGINSIATHPTRRLTICHLLGTFLRRNLIIEYMKGCTPSEFCPEPTLFDLQLFINTHLANRDGEEFRLYQVGVSVPGQGAVKREAEGASVEHGGMQQEMLKKLMLLVEENTSMKEAFLAQQQQLVLAVTSMKDIADKIVHQADGASGSREAPTGHDLNTPD